MYTIEEITDLVISMRYLDFRILKNQTTSNEIWLINNDLKKVVIVPEERTVKYYKWIKYPNRKKTYKSNVSITKIIQYIQNAVTPCAAKTWTLSKSIIKELEYKNTTNCNAKMPP